MQRTATHNMGLFVPLVVSLLLIAGGGVGGGWHASFADAATMATPKSQTPMAYWETMLPGISVPPAISDLLAQQNVLASLDGVTISPNNINFLGGLRKIGPNYEKVKLEHDHGDKHVHIASQAEDELKEISMSYGSQGEEGTKKDMMVHKSNIRKGLKGTSMSLESLVKEEVEKTFSLHKQKTEENPKEISVSYGIEGGESVKEISMSYRTKQNKNTLEVMESYGTEQEGNLKEISVSYGSDEGKDGCNEVSNQHEKDQNKETMSYGSEQEDDPSKITMSYGKEQEEEPSKLKMSYGLEQEDNPSKITMSYGSEQQDEPSKLTMSYGSEEKDDPSKLTMSYGSEQEDDPSKITMSYGSEQKEDLKANSSRQEIRMNGEGSHHHDHTHIHSNKRQQADIFFFHDTLRLGSIITPTIPATTSLPVLFTRSVANSIPFSMQRLSDIVAMFTPVSLQMIREMRWTLDTCEKPRTLPGQKTGCATSLESLTELSASLLGTRNIHAFSAADLPVEAPGTRALRGRYNVTAVRKLSGQSSEIVTCHDLTYPYMVYYCHTANPTAAYSVTLTSLEDTTTPSTLEALAVCHLDTSRWSPKNPFFEMHNLKPGEVTVCHFLTKLSIIWVPDGKQRDAQTTTR